MAFHEVRFPTGISLGASGGPGRKTEIVVLGSGHEERNAVWANSRRNYNIGYGLKTVNDLHAVIAFFEARMGRLYGFRFKDFADFKSCPPSSALTPFDQSIGTGNGSATAFQLKKTYTSGPSSYVRTINKPVSGSVRVGKAGIEQMSGWTVDTTTGIVTFSVAPANGQAITAGFEFDVPARFDTDMLSINLENFKAGAIQSIPIVELRV